MDFALGECRLLNRLLEYTSRKKEKDEDTIMLDKYFRNRSVGNYCTISAESFDAADILHVQGCLPTADYAEHLARGVYPRQNFLHRYSTL